MKIWISKNSEVPVREQLIAQVTLAITAGDFAAGEKLPSTRELARRCDLHSNTISAAYRRLVDQQLLEFRKGSGFYVAEFANERIEGTRKLEKLIEELLAEAKALGFDDDDVIGHLRKRLHTEVAQKLLVVESDDALRDILVYELRERFPETRGISFDEFIAIGFPASTILAAMPDEKSKIDPVLKHGQQCIYLKGRSVSASMTNQVRPAADETIAVVSNWENFLSFARIMLLAANVDPGNLIVRSTVENGWRKAISRASLVICDSLTARMLGDLPNVKPFSIISDPSFAELSVLIRS
ncbi:MAG: hypothetical protein DMF63_06725 [Acidobacteria bacterium]|nr:MAG: hypothetical protein DMF63_06725 [Acidobacteriota bacterium]